MKSKNAEALFSFDHLNTRKKASSGLWMAAILPIACSPGLYQALSHCQPSPNVLSILALEVGLSSVYTLTTLSNKMKIAEKGVMASQKSWSWAILLHTYLLPLVSSLVLFQLANLGMMECIAIAFMCKEVQHRFTKWLFRNFSDSFSIGEGLLVGQAAALVFTLSLKGIFVLPKSYSEYQQVLSFIQTSVLTVGVLGFLIWKLRRRLTLLTLLMLILWMSIAGIGVSSALLREWSPIWLFHLLTSSPTKLALIGWWTNISILIFFISTVAKRFSHISQTVWRKAYHLLLILIVIPGIAKDPLFTHLACTGAVLLFLLLEIIRYVDIQPIKNWLTKEFAIFLDEKDGGSLILSHIYLIAGLAAPLWICPCSFTNFVHVDKHSSQVDFAELRQNVMGFDAASSKFIEDSGFERSSLKVQVSPLALYAGVLTVGIGDALASVCGTYFGKHRWKGTNKTIEGTLCSIFSQVILVSLFTMFGLVSLTMHNWWKFAFGVVITSFIEAFTDQVDNIVLPLILYTPLIEP